MLEVGFGGGELIESLLFKQWLGGVAGVDRSPLAVASLRARLTTYVDGGRLVLAYRKESLLNETRWAGAYRHRASEVEATLRAAGFADVKTTLGSARKCFFIVARAA